MKHRKTAAILNIGTSQGLVDRLDADRRKLERLHGPDRHLIGKELNSGHDEAKRYGLRTHRSTVPSVVTTFLAHRHLRDKVRAVTGRSKAERPVAAAVADLNPVLRRWGAYFRNGNFGRKLSAVDGYVHERLAILASRKHGLRGRNWTARFTYGWITRLGVYRLTGTVRRVTVHASW